MNDQPQRSEQEWTAERDGAICGVLKRNGEVVETGLHFALCERLAKTINAALAAEREKHAEEYLSFRHRLLNAYEKQLATEQERRERAEQDLKEMQEFFGSKGP